MSLLPNYETGTGTWICFSCKQPLEQKKVQVTYLDSSFDVILPCCCQCGQCFVPKDLAMGKMQEVESLLEDK